MRWELEDGFVVDDDEVLSCEEVSRKTLYLKIGQAKPIPDDETKETSTTPTASPTETASSSGTLLTCYIHVLLRLAGN